MEEGKKGLRQCHLTEFELFMDQFIIYVMAFLPDEFGSHEDSQYSWKIAECEDKYNHQQIIQFRI